MLTWTFRIINGKLVAIANCLSQNIYSVTLYALECQPCLQLKIMRVFRFRLLFFLFFLFFALVLFCLVAVGLSSFFRSFFLSASLSSFLEVDEEKCPNDAVYYTIVTYTEQYWVEICRNLFLLFVVVTAFFSLPPVCVLVLGRFLVLLLRNRLFLYHAIDTGETTTTTRNGHSDNDDDYYDDEDDDYNDHEDNGDDDDDFMTVWFERMAAYEMIYWNNSSMRLRLPQPLTVHLITISHSSYYP